jgi:MoaA/NifB/PqqE/SkfB family radical SAM enzyme
MARAHHTASELITQSKIEALNRDFDRVLSSEWRRRRMMWRMNFNRLLQSAMIVGGQPKIWRAIARGMLGATRDMASSLRSLEVAVTYHCNAHCEQCSCRLAMDRERERDERLSESEFKGAIDQAAALGAFQFCINGGEPMIDKDMVLNLARHVRDAHGGYVHLVSNGYLLTMDVVAELKEAGVDSIEMGLDSADPETHDANRLPGSYERIIRNIEYCRKNNIKVILNTVLTNEKVRSADILNTVFLARKHGCLLQITPCCLTGAYKGRRDLMLTDEAILYFHWLLALSWNNRSDLYSSLSAIKCPAAREKIALQPYGDVVSCPLIQIPYGNVRERPLRDIRADMLVNPYYNLKQSQGCLPAMSREFIDRYLMD